MILDTSLNPKHFGPRAYITQNVMALIKRRLGLLTMPHLANNRGHISWHVDVKCPGDAERMWKMSESAKVKAKLVLKPSVPKVSSLVLHKMGFDKRA